MVLVSSPDFDIETEHSEEEDWEEEEEKTEEGPGLAALMKPAQAPAPATPAAPQSQVGCTFSLRPSPFRGTSLF